MNDVEDLRDPRQALDAAYASQLDLLARARQAVADVVTARKRLELQARQLRPAVARLEAQGATSEALTWRTALEGELAQLDRQMTALSGQEARLRQLASGLDLRVRQLAVRRDGLLAGHQAARGRAEVGQLLADLRTGDAELLQAVQEAEQRREEELLWGPAAQEERRQEHEQRNEGR